MPLRSFVHLPATIHHRDPFVSRLTFAHEFPFVHFCPASLMSPAHVLLARGSAGMAKHHYKLRTLEIGQRLLALRNQTRLTQIELGQLIGVSRRSILKWEGGE